MPTFPSRQPTHHADIEMMEGAARPRRPSEDVPISTGVDVDQEASDARPLLRASDDDGDDHDSIDVELLAKKNYDEDALVWYKSWWQNRIPSRWAALVTTGLITLAGAIVLALFFRTRSGMSKYTGAGKSSWKGFSNIENIYAFGDSWTTTHFWAQGEQPSPANPLGNPPLPGFTSTNGMNYVGYLGTQYNHSFIKVYDLAFAGSTIDAEIDRTMLDWLDLAHQIKEEFIKFWIGNETGVPQPIGWTPENTLFTSFFGINDVIVYNRSSHELRHVFANYEKLISDLYDLSARNFLIINIPPIDKAPSITYFKTPEEQKVFAADMEDFNGLIRDLVAHLKRKYKDITIFDYDVHDLFERVIANPQSVPQTAGYKETMKFCKGYDQLEQGAIPTQEQIDSCGGLQVEEYLWLNMLHVTPPVHEAMAAEIEKLLVD